MFASACGVNGAAHSKASAAAGGLPALPLRFSDPLRALLCWIALLFQQGQLDSTLLALAGLTPEDLHAFAAENARDLGYLREIRLAGLFFRRQNLGILLRARLAEMLMGATKAQEMAALVKAISQAPDWAFGDAESQAGENDEVVLDEAVLDEMSRMELTEEQAAKLRDFAAQFRAAALADLKTEKLNSEELLELNEALQVMDAIDLAAQSNRSGRRARSADLRKRAGRNRHSQPRRR